MMGMRTEEHCLRSQVEIGSESDCLLGQLCKILEISDSEAGLNVEKVGGVVGGGTELAEVQEGRGEDDLRCSRLLIVCQRERGLSEEEDTRLE